ncbi:2,3-dihydroxybiphenyl 1,2-dioxygenase [Streptomyces himalayensis]|uniref:2,3-dihydroxybiphenyl 1,2-dioxygenase n=1 Tax=Streptomyces himalayensis subsp. himalayensis TaxID=2756131 RepID=A0A7W0DKM4_9ACTN|nr:2,3-dihydroxybiphenyl 1,2-dioxygenase [Streptomyces himalayensis]MBA2946838.1 2,3-dihydroxybiphenyl 1,2-dioxygenase [Streptomyces himalayensis subsp. himalayensis]
MARLVEVMCAPHDPTIPATRHRRATLPEGEMRTLEAFELLQARLDAARPDVIVMVSGDHLNQWFMDDMPQFLIGKAPRARGPFPHERHAFGLDDYDTEIEGALARHLLNKGIEGHFDLSYSNEFTLDHGFVVPLSLLRPEQDTPVVPLFTNVMAPPIPPGRRFHELGHAVRELIEGFDADTRVAVVTSGHMTNNIGGPEMLDFAEQPLTDWDTSTWHRLHHGDIGELVDECTFDHLYSHGHGTPGFLDYVFALGLVGDERPDWSELTSGPTQLPAAFLQWTDRTLNGAAR